MSAGAVARSLHGAYLAVFPEPRFSVWNRIRATAEAMAAEWGIDAVDDLADTVAGADIVTTATKTTEPVINGQCLQPDTHVDLIGAHLDLMTSRHILDRWTSGEL